MPVEPSLAVSGTIKVSQADLSLECAYKRNIEAYAEIGQGDCALLEWVYKRNLTSNVNVGASTCSFDPSIKRALTQNIKVGSAFPTVVLSINKAIEATIPIGYANPQLELAFKRVIQTQFSMDNGDVKLDPSVKWGITGDIKIDESEPHLIFLYRKFQYPPPTIRLEKVTVGKTTPLNGTQINAGDAVAFDIILRGYLLDVLLLKTGPYLQVTFKRNMSDPDVAAMVVKTSTGVPSGIFFKPESLVELQNTELGVIQELKGQMRLFPQDTQKEGNKTVWYEVEYIDPLAEVHTLEMGSFKLLGQVRNA